MAYSSTVHSRSRFGVPPRQSLKVVAALTLAAQVLYCARMTRQRVQIVPNFRARAMLLSTASRSRATSHRRPRKAPLALGVEVRTGIGVTGAHKVDRSVKAVTAGDWVFEADQFLISAGAWSGPLAQQLECPLSILGVRRGADTPRRHKQECAAIRDASPLPRLGPTRPGGRRETLRGGSPPPSPLPGGDPMGP